MPASHDELHATITRLHEELATAEIDDATASELRAAIADIQEALQRRRDDASTAPSRTPEGDGAASDSLAEAARAFESSHPIISRTVNQIVDMLAQMGI